MTITTTTAATDEQVAERQLHTEPNTGKAWWFLGTLAVLRNPEGAPRTPTVIELTVPPGGSPPRHVHESLDDSFYLLAGEVVVRCGDRTVVGRPGTYVRLPAGIEHTFRVTSTQPARMLLVHEDDSFLSLIEALGVPAQERQLPPPGHPDPDAETIMRALEEHGSPAVGPSLEDDEARRFVEPAGDRQATLGPVNHVALTVTDLRRSAEWYCHAFDLLQVDGEIDGDGAGHVALLSPDGGWLLGIGGPSREAAVEHVAVSCADRDELVRWRDRLAERGVSPGTITDAPYGSGFVVRDPDGLELELFAPAPPAG